MLDFDKCELYYHDHILSQPSMYLGRTIVWKVGKQYEKVYKPVCNDRIVSEGAGISRFRHIKEHTKMRWILM